MSLKCLIVDLVCKALGVTVRLDGIPLGVKLPSSSVVSDRKPASSANYNCSPQ